jgi:hypothetical protein
MGQLFSKTPEEQLKSFFKREIQGKTKCTFTGALNAYSQSDLNNFDNWLVSNGYSVDRAENFINGTVTYNIAKNK